MVKDIIIVLIASFITIFVIVVAFLISDTKTYNKSVVSTTEFQRPKEKRYVYVILGRIPPYNMVKFTNIESDTKLTYQQLKRKSPFEIMSINVLDRKTGKF